MVTPVIQSAYRRYEQAGWPGALARPHAPYAFDSGQIRVPTGGVAPAPGYPVYWDATNNRFALPTTDALNQTVCGILSYDGGTVASSLSATTENSPLGIEYKNDAVVKIGVLGTFWGIAAEAMKYGDLVEWEWRTTSPTVTDGEQRWKKRTGFAASAPELPAAGDTNGLSTAWNAATAKTAIDAIIASVYSAVTVGVYRLPIAVADPQPVSAGELVLLRVGYQVR